MEHHRPYRNPPIEEALQKSSEYTVFEDVGFAERHEEDNQDLADHRRRRKARLEIALHAAFESDPLEDGFHHPAEEIIATALVSAGVPEILVWLKGFVLDTEQLGHAASVLRCLGRQHRPGTERWRIELVRDALAAEDVEIRDAAVQTAELWADAGMSDVLRNHDESVPWLADYIEEVVEDIAASSQR